MSAEFGRFGWLGAPLICRVPRGTGLPCRVRALILISSSKIGVNNDHFHSGEFITQLISVVPIFSSLTLTHSRHSHLRANVYTIMHTALHAT